MLSKVKYITGAAAIAAATVGFAAPVYAQSAESHQNFNAHTKKCVDLGFLGHACTPDVHITGTVYEKVAFLPNPEAAVRLKVNSPVSFDTGFKSINLTNCVPAQGVSYLGNGVQYCPRIKDIHVSSNEIRFDMAMALQLTISIPGVKSWKVEVPLSHRNVHVKR